jgi:aspartate aminotransferase
MIRESYLRRRDLVVNMLKEIPGLKVNLPMGAFYVFPDVSSFFGKTDGTIIINSAADLCMFVLRDCGVAIVTGEAFGESNCVRISYATSDEILVIAINRIKECLKKLQ